MRHVLPLTLFPIEADHRDPAFWGIGRFPMPALR